ncbi:phage tail length tape measure family protein [uncultured Brevundimonas sp.]|uniref:phage tail length tape measure family protein n=1 Tax=uncultured Brevundimonas sp. TaxID=213418 RepID=UPI0025CD49CA|nr:phage tail length tape measure family protein [uncultured Brevundimonas sp.]
MPTKNVAIRLQTEGKAEVQRDAADVGTSLENAYEKGARGAADATAAAQKHEQALKSSVATGGNVIAAQERFNARQVASDKAKANALRGALDPTFAAQQRLNEELREYDTLLKRDAITLKEHAAAQALSRQRFDETTEAIKRNGNVVSLAQRRNAGLNLARQGADVFTSLGGGISPGMVAIQQGPQILDAIATGGFKVSASMVAAGAAVAVVAGAVIGLGAAWAAGEASNAAYERAVSGIGRTAGLTAEELKALTVAGAEQGDISVSAAQKQAAAYLATGRIGGEVLTDLIAIGKDYASVMGLDAEAATQSLAKAMLEPDKAGRDLTRTMGLLDQKTLDQIDSLVRSGDLLGAQKLLLEALDGAVAKHAENAGAITNAWDAIGNSISNAITKLGEFLYLDEGERLQQIIDRRSSIERGQRENGRPLDARTQGIYDTYGREGQAILDQRRQRADAAAEAGRNQAAQLARDRVTNNGGARGGGGGSSGASAARDAARDAEQAARRADQLANYQLQTQISLAKLRGEETTELERQLQVREVTARLISMGIPEAQARVDAEAQVAATFQAEATNRARALAAEAEQRAARMDDLRLRQQRALAEARGDNTDALDRELHLRELIGQFESAGLTNAQARVEAQRQVVAETEAEAEARRRAMAAAAADRQGNTRALASLKEGAIGVFDTFGDLIARGKTGWAEWKDAGASAIRDIMAEFVRLAALNPLKNALFGSDLPTITNSKGLFSQIWNSVTGAFKPGTGGSGGGTVYGIGGVGGGALPGNAQGTNYWRGGLTWVGESGRELVNLPRGAQVFDAVRSQDMARSRREVIPASMPITIVARDPASFQNSKAQIAAQMMRMVQMASRVT